MHGMELDIINGEHQGLIFPAWRLVLPMTPKRIILPENGARSDESEEKGNRRGRVLTLDPYLRCS